MGQRGLGFVGTVVGIGALLLVTMPRSATPEAQADAATTATGSAQPSATAGYTTFISTVHQYAFMLPPGWTARDSEDPAIPDLVDGPAGQVLAVWLAHLPEGGATDAWIADRMPVRRVAFGSCIHDTRFASKRSQFAPSRVGDIDARVRRSCGYVEAVAIAGDRAWIVSLADDSSPMGDMVSFRLLTDTFGSLPDPAVPPPPPRPTPTPTPAPTVPADWVEFTSPFHGYSLRYPADWSARPAEDPGAGDVFFQGHNGLPWGQNRLVVHRRSVPARPFAVAWAEAAIPRRAQMDGTHRHCVFYSDVTSIMEAPLATFRPTEVLGRPAAIRSLCGHVDAVIDLGNAVLVLSHQSAGKMPRGNEEIFAKFVAGLRLAADPR